ncbi:MAG: SpoIIE family protein phosphatase [Eubacterium sp.]|nr:SpoIIE family protein phosphatase [Eubacterium sp.]
MKTVAPQKEELSRNTKNSGVKKITEAAVFFALGFTLSSCFVLRVASPFSISLISVSKKNNFIYSAVGSALGYLAFCPDNFARYAVAVVIVALGTFALALAEAKNQPWFPMLLSFLSLLATGVVVNLKMGEGAARYALVFAESVLGLGGAYFFFRSINCNFRRFRFKALPVSDLTCIITSVSVILMGLSRLTIGGFSPARMLAVIIILLTAHYGADRLGLILALVLGFSLGVEDTGTVFLAGAYAFSAMLATIFCTESKWSAATSFSLCVALFSVAAGDESGIFIIIESVAGGIAFAFMPRLVTDKIEEFFHDGAGITPDGSLRQSLVVRLRFASSAMHHISESVNEVREKINDINAKNALMAKAELTEQEYIAQEIINEKTNEIRMVASDQFFSISDMLADLAKEFDEAEYFDNIAAGKIRRLLGEYEIYPRNISVIEDKFGRMRIEIMTKGRESAISRTDIQKQISKICNRYFERGRVTHFRDDSMITFAERPNYSFEIGFAQHSAEGRLCGDTVKTVNDGKGHCILIISDGMGRGGRAALDGAMGAGLLSKLLCAGFGFDSALKVVNSALLVKSNEESLATLDCASVDLFTGRVDLYKAGAPATYIVKGNRVEKCELTSMPAGILRGIEFAKRTAVLSNGNLIVMVSDGIIDVGGDWLPAMLRGFEDASPQEIADTVLREALNIAQGKKEDDMSIIAARLNML